MTNNGENNDALVPNNTGNIPGKRWKRTREPITTVEHAADATEPHPDAAEVRPNATGAKKACKTKQNPMIVCPTGAARIPEIMKHPHTGNTPAELGIQ